jgi:hypothetical protein
MKLGFSISPVAATIIPSGAFRVVGREVVQFDWESKSSKENDVHLTGLIPQKDSRIT